MKIEFDNFEFVSLENIEHYKEKEVFGKTPIGKTSVREENSYVQGRKLQLNASEETSAEAIPKMELQPLKKEIDKERANEINKTERKKQRKKYRKK